MNQKKLHQVSRAKKLRFRITPFLGIVILGVILISSISNPTNNLLNPGTKVNPVLTSKPTEAINSDGSISGVGQNLTATEYAQSTNTSTANSLKTNTSNIMGYIDTPPLWTGYELFTGVSGLSDNRSWVVNGTLPAGGTLTPNGPWQYDELDFENIDNGATRNIYENCWGWYENPGTVPGTSSGAFWLDHGYYQEHAPPPPGDYQDGREYCAFNQTIFVDRGTISAVKIKFDFNATTGYNSAYNYPGWDYLFVSMNGYIVSFNVFASSYSPHNTWVHQEWDMPVLDIPAVFTTPGNVVFKIGIHQRTDQAYWESATVARDAVHITNVSLFLQSAVKPSQVQLKVNGTAIADSSYGSGNLTLKGSWTNTNGSLYQPNTLNFTQGNSTDVKFDYSLTQFVNHTRTTQIFTGEDGSDFNCQNSTPSNWTTYIYASNPLNHVQYNFSVYFPTDWTIWALYDPSPADVVGLPGITAVPGSGVLQVEPVRANAFPGVWRIEFNSPNYVTSLTTYRNTTLSPGPTDWTPVDSYFAGDYINISAQVSGSQPITGTSVRLEIRFPNGTIWDAHSQYKTLDVSGIVNFDAFQIPLSGADYVAGDYNIFIAWNNTQGIMPCNETGLRSKIIPIRHLSVLIPDNSFLPGVINGTVEKIRVSYKDMLSGEPITGASLSFVNFSGSVQTMTEIGPGYYSADLLVAISGDSGYYDRTVNATHPFFTAQQVNITLDIILDSSLTSSIYPTIAVQSNENFTLELRYNQTGKSIGIGGADIWISYDDEWTLTPGGDPGQYNLTGNNSLFAANTIHKLEIGAQKLGFRPQNLSINVKVMPRTAIFENIYMNGINSTLLPKYEMNITTWLNLSVQLCDEVLGAPLLGSEVNITGVNATPSPLNPVGDYWEILLNSSALGKGVHFLTLIGNASNHVLATIVIQVTVDQLITDIHTEDDKNTYYRYVGEDFAFKIIIDNLVFGGNITAYIVSYEWRFGSNILTGPDAEGYFYADLTDLPIGVWTITIRVNASGSDYEINDLLIKLTVTEPVNPGIPEWVIYSLIGAIGAVIVIFALYETKFKYPPIIRDVRSLKSQVRRGKPLTVQVRGNDLPKILAGAYLAESKGALTSTQQELLKGQHIKTGKGAPVEREVKEILAPPPSEAAEINKPPTPSVSPTQQPVKPKPEVAKPAVVAPTPTPAPIPTPALVPEKPAAPKPSSPPITPIPERFLKLIQEKPAATVKPSLPQVKGLPAVKPLPEVKELPQKPATKPAPNPEDKPGDDSSKTDGENKDK